MDNRNSRDDFTPGENEGLLEQLQPSSLTARGFGVQPGRERAALVADARRRRAFSIAAAYLSRRLRMMPASASRRAVSASP